MAPVRVRLNFPQWLKRLFFTGHYFISGCVKLYHNTLKTAWIHSNKGRPWNCTNGETNYPIQTVKTNQWTHISLDTHCDTHESTSYAWKLDQTIQHTCNGLLYPSPHTCWARVPSPWLSAAVLPVAGPWIACPISFRTQAGVKTNNDLHWEK